ncbi:MAG: ATP-binding cassette domain-containing protein [Dissulfuribacterales bacterium]
MQEYLQTAGDGGWHSKADPEAGEPGTGEIQRTGVFSKPDLSGPRVCQVFSLFPVLKERQKQRAGTLSSGEQRMLAIGRALMLEPELLLLDEPSLGLSPNYVDILFEKIKEINRDGTAILLVEQNARMALEYADRGYVFEIGKIAFQDEAKNLLENDEVRRSFLGERSLI